jgi:hypothetical protein
MLSGHSHLYTRTHLDRAGQIVQRNAASDYTKAHGRTGTVYIMAGTGGAAYQPRQDKEKP